VLRLFLTLIGWVTNTAGSVTYLDPNAALKSAASFALSSAERPGVRASSLKFPL
jgi:hypothetical protein